MAAMETIQFKVPHQVKQDFIRKCERAGKTMSDEARSVFEAYLYGEKDPLDELEDIFSDADEKLTAAALREPTIEEINEYCANIRAERASQMLLAG